MGYALVLGDTFQLFRGRFGLLVNMSRETQLINCPESGELLDLPEGVNKIEWIPDTKFSFCGTFIIHLEDHTIGTLIKSQLNLDENVIFVGYRIPHPLESLLELRVKTRSKSPISSLLYALGMLKSNISSLKSDYMVIYANLVKNSITSPLALISAN